MRAHHYCYYLLNAFSISKYISDSKQATAFFVKTKQIANAALLCAQIGKSSIKWTMNFSRIDDIMRYRHCYITLHYITSSPRMPTCPEPSNRFGVQDVRPIPQQIASCKQLTLNRQNALVHNLMGKLSVVHVCCASLKSS